VNNLTKERTSGKFKEIPRKLWRNNYPIVLVHGFAGGVPD
jgi:hypothetical protein